MAIVNGFHLLTIGSGAIVKSLMCYGSYIHFWFSEIFNDKVIFVRKCKVTFSTLTVISYDLVVPTLITES